MSDSATPWTVAYWAPLSMGFSRQEYWSGLPFPSPENLPDPGIDLGLLHCRQMLYHLSHKGSPVEVSVQLLLSCVRLFATPWTVAYHVPLSMEFSREECWSGLHSLLQGEILPNPGIEPWSPTLQVDFLPSEATREAHNKKGIS